MPEYIILVNKFGGGNMKLFEIVRTKDLKSFYVVAKDANAAMQKHLKKLDKKNEDKEALLFDIGLSLVLKHSGNVYCVIKNNREAKKRSKIARKLSEKFKENPLKCFNCFRYNEDPIILIDDMGPCFMCEHCGHENCDMDLDEEFAKLAEGDESFKDWLEEYNNLIEMIELEMSELEMSELELEE